MKLRQNRLIVGVGAIVLLALAAWFVNRPPRPERFQSPIPRIDPAKLTRVEIARPNEPVTRLEKNGDAWRVVAPIEAPADRQGIQSALDRLRDLRVVSVEAQSPASHAALKVDDATGVRVQLYEGDRSVANFIVGTQPSGGATMLRPPGQNLVYRAEGTLSYSFNKALRDWRDRVIFDLQPNDAVRLAMHNPHGDLEFTKNGNDWQPPTSKGRPVKIDNFDRNKVQSVLTTLAHLRATDFADGTSAAEAGLGEAAATVAVTMRDNSVMTLLIGQIRTQGSLQQYYVRRADRETVYLISKFLGDRFLGKPDDFKGTPPGKAPPPGRLAGPPGMPGAMPPGMPGMPGHAPGGAPGGQQIPPEIMQKIQQQMRQQQMMKQLAGPR